jgi:hypothetical protein
VYRAFAESRKYLPVPNYRQTLRDISIGMAISGISTTRSLDLLPFLGRGCNNMSDLPSWAPSWFNLDQMSSDTQLKYLAQGRRRPPFETANRSVKGQKYSTAGNTFAKVHISDEVLRTYGFLFDEVDGLSHTLSERGQPLSIRNMSRSVPKINMYKDKWDLMEAAANDLTLGAESPYHFLPQGLDVLCRCIAVPQFELRPNSTTALSQNSRGSSLDVDLSLRDDSHGFTTLEWLVREMDPHVRKKRDRERVRQDGPKINIT